MGVDCVAARIELARVAARLREHARRAVVTRARQLASLSRAPVEQLQRQRVRLHQQLRELRAGSRRRIREHESLNGRRALVLGRKGASALRDCRERHPRELERLALALAAHDPQRTLERGYVLVQSPAGEPLPTAARAREARDVSLRFADGTLAAHVEKS